MKELGLQAAARIVASSEPLRALTQMAQNFPNLAAALSRVAVPKQLRAELKKLHRVLQGGLRLLPWQDDLVMSPEYLLSAFL